MNEKPFIALPTLTGVELISPNDIISVFSDDKTISISIENRPKKTINISIGRAEKALDQNCFVRCHQRHIVNVLKIKEVRNQCSLVLLSNGEQIPISRSCKNEFKQILDSFCNKLGGLEC